VLVFVSAKCSPRQGKARPRHNRRDAEPADGVGIGGQVPRLIWLASGSVAGVPTTCLDAFPKLCNLIAKLSALPEVVAWNEKVSAAGSPPDCPPPAA
jgi:hypothetical protein